jgi:hypothetical protein
MAKAGEEILKFFPQLYVGIRQERPYVKPGDPVPEHTCIGFNTEDPPLGFATQITNDSGYTKRKETVDHWSRGYNFGTNEYEGTIIENVPVEGFQFDKIASRYSTDNKMVRLNDPRGFQLEITTYNLMDLLLHASVKNGMLEGKYIWGRQKGTNFLTREDHPSYLEHLSPKIERTKLQAGDVIRLNDIEYVFVASAYIYQFDMKQEWIVNATQQPYIDPRGNRYYYQRDTGLSRQYCTFDKKDQKPWAIFLPVAKPSYGGYLFSVRRMPSKFTILRQNEEISLDFQYGNKYDLNFSTYSELSYGIPFETKQSLNDYEPDFSIRDFVYDIRNIASTEEHTRKTIAQNVERMGKSQWDRYVAPDPSTYMAAAKPLHFRKT